MKKGRNSGNEDEEGEQLWQGVTRSVKAYHPARQKLEKSPPVKKTPAVSKTPAIPVLEKPPAKGFDRATETRFRRGQLPLEGALDLHGMTQTEAFDALYVFLSAAIAHGKRTVLVITGKGLRSEGVLKKMLPLWLEEPKLRPHIIAVSLAQPKDGGSGAFYLRLRRQR